MISLALLDRLATHAAERGDTVAYREILSGRTITWKQLHDQVNVAAMRYASQPPGAAIVCYVNRIEFPVAFLGLLAAGREVFPVAAEIATAELSRAAEISRATIFLGDRPAPPPQVGFDAPPALLLQSSGTTGLPKIVRRSAKSLDAVSAQMADAIGFTPADHVLAAVPLSHSYGLEHGLLAPVWAGSCVHLCHGLDLAAVEAELSRGQITIFPGVPAMYEMLANVAVAPIASSLRVAYSAGAPLPASVAERIASRFGVRVTQLYGASEIGSVTFNDATRGEFDAASVGWPMAGVELRVLDVDAQSPLPPGETGHIAVRAASMFDGYLQEDAGLLDGFFLTGDLGHVDARGRLFITGRLKLLIDVGGQKVNPLEVEAVMCHHPQVAECVVVPMRQSETVHRLKAVVTPRVAGEVPTTESLRAFARERLSAYKVPRLFEVRSELPKSATGKVQRQEID